MASNIKQDMKRTVHKVARAESSPWVETLERFGYLVRGAIYFIIGALAVQLALGAGGQATDYTGAIEMIRAQPLGRALLTLVAIGLTGYSLWGFSRAFLDPLRRGSDVKGLVERAGFLVSGISYGALVIPTAEFELNRPAGPTTGNPAVLSAQLAGHPFGRWLVAAFGLLWLAAATGQFYTAYTQHFVRDLDRGKLTREEYGWARRIGSFGYAARGVVFGLIGWFVLESGLTADPGKAVGFDGALLKLTQAPYGTALLAVVALGLVAFGFYSALCAKWNKVR
jgi:Domain of Unknown Function (DUF1206)